MNTKSPSTGIHLRDPLRQLIKSQHQPALSFLNSFKDMVRQIKPVCLRRSVREMTLSTETSQALVRTIDGYISMVDFLLSKDYSYVLLGRYTSDHIEKLFGKWRQAYGSNYYISVADVIMTERIQWAKVTRMVLGRPITTQSSHHCELCSADPSQLFDLNIDFEDAPNQLRGVSAYVGGWVDMCASSFLFCPLF